MKTYAIPLIDKRAWGEDAVMLRFERPQGYEFRAGQYAVFRVETPDGPVGKPFTIASAPGDAWLEVTTRISSSAFKRALDALVPGQCVEVSEPAGRFVLPDGVERLVFLVGGVGVTPARSMLRDAQQRDALVETMLFYGNRSNACVPYRDEFDTMVESGVDLVHVLEQPPVGWEGESGFITADLVRRHGALERPALWITAGPPVMVEAMERVLDDLGIPAKDRMVERFSGYA